MSTGRYPVKALEGWTIRPGVIHAPGPYPTFEIQFAQDDFHLASMLFATKLSNANKFIGWTLGARVPKEKRDELRQNVQMRGVRDEKEWVDTLLRWDLCTDKDFKYVMR